MFNVENEICFIAVDIFLIKTCYISIDNNYIIFQYNW